MVCGAAEDGTVASMGLQRNPCPCFRFLPGLPSIPRQMNSVPSLHLMERYSRAPCYLPYYSMSRQMWVGRIGMLGRSSKVPETLCLRTA